ncbi:MAG TPA: hypothetical protein VKE42_11750, partial [Candidatus Cybelea sp.]|nr:hypothetical protein [Candidatus Cybelea sp.]
GFTGSVIPTPALASNQLVAVEAGAIASGFSHLPQIDIATETTLHFEDTSPQQIGTTGSPNAVAAPTRSLWQTNQLALRCIVRCAWVVRAPGLVQTVTSATW